MIWVTVMDWEHYPLVQPITSALTIHWMTEKAAEAVFDIPLYEQRTMPVPPVPLDSMCHCQATAPLIDEVACR